MYFWVQCLSITVSIATQPKQHIRPWDDSTASPRTHSLICLLPSTGQRAKVNDPMSVLHYRGRVVNTCTKDHLRSQVFPGSSFWSLVVYLTTAHITSQVLDTKFTFISITWPKHGAGEGLGTRLLSPEYKTTTYLARFQSINTNTSWALHREQKLDYTSVLQAHSSDWIQNVYL